MRGIGVLLLLGSLSVLSGWMKAIKNGGESMEFWSWGRSVISVTEVVISFRRSHFIWFTGTL